MQEIAIGKTKWVGDKARVYCIYIKGNVGQALYLHLYLGQAQFLCQLGHFILVFFGAVVLQARFVNFLQLFPLGIGKESSFPESKITKGVQTPSKKNQRAAGPYLYQCKHPIHAYIFFIPLFYLAPSVVDCNILNPIDSAIYARYVEREARQFHVKIYYVQVLQRLW